MIHRFPVALPALLLPAVLLLGCAGSLPSGGGMGMTGLVAGTYTGMITTTVTVSDVNSGEIVSSAQDMRAISLRIGPDGIPLRPDGQPFAVGLIDSTEVNGQVLTSQITAIDASTERVVISLDVTADLAGSQATGTQESTVEAIDDGTVMFTETSELVSNAFRLTSVSQANLAR